MPHLEKIPQRSKASVKTFVIALVELHLFAVLFFAVALTLFHLAGPAPAAIVLPHAMLASYAAALLFVAADRLF
ncbi:hypothetical protein GCM10023188_19420 [Pontibacter saemangeumensis]|uniref:Chlorhexidine efflux transporter domain-containing protein n=1 Tax=Pontibacter saemangeumensis TaxID=1084525 RepID=A0ABP8LL12_9BACT